MSDIQRNHSRCPKASSLCFLSKYPCYSRSLRRCRCHFFFTAPGKWRYSRSFSSQQNIPFRQDEKNTVSEDKSDIGWGGVARAMRVPSFVFFKSDT